MTQPAGADEPRFIEEEELRRPHTFGRKIPSLLESTSELEKGVGIVQEKREPLVAFVAKLLGEISKGDLVSNSIEALTAKRSGAHRKFLDRSRHTSGFR